MTMKSALAYVILPDGFRVDVEVAETAEARARGLMFRDALDEREGMLFRFDAPGRYGFWMKNVRIPLDIIWLDARSRVAWIVEWAEPCAADPCPMHVPAADAICVLEVVGGFVARHGVAAGHRVVVKPVS
jgi:uncharacterized membrane protein (UPF0127 family)